ncbi:hypothetical protein ACP4OV_017123 [Aristida adscensionis]
MAGGGGGGDEEERMGLGFKFLAAARYTAAAVVTVLAVVVVGQVIAVALRPGSIQLSVLQGYVEATTDLWMEHEVKAGNDAGGDGTVMKAPVQSAGSYVYTYTAADSVGLVVILTTDNPSGRVDINCTDLAITLFDMPDGYDSLVLLQSYHWNDSFLVEGESSHTMRLPMVLSNNTALTYIANTYGGISSFQALLEVNVIAKSMFKLGKPAATTTRYYCWPVTVTSDVPSHSEDVPCNLLPPRMSHVGGFLVSYNFTHRFS